MKRYFSGILILSFTFINMYAQQISGRRASVEERESSPTVSVRAQNMYGNAEVNTDNLIWMREIYRDLDLKNEKNGPLYFPVEPIGDRVNLFTLIFNVLAEGKIPAYEYLIDGREVFTDQYKVNFEKDVLNKYGIYYEAKFSKSSKNPVYQINDSDLPSNEVLNFFIKEMWYFDKSNSTFDSKILALCPVYSRSGEYGGEAYKVGMFWIAYDDIRPYLSQVQVMTSNYNNVTNSTYDDYFRQKLYKGDIYKVTNLANLALVQYCPTDSAMRVEQKKIENEISAFEKRLWQQPNSTDLAVLKSKKNLTKSERELLRKLEADEKATSEVDNNESDSSSDEAAPTASTPVKKSVKSSSKSSTKQPSVKSSSSSSKAPKTKSAPTRSVRRR